jgi:excisionase family DNA binding protein
MSTLTLGLDEAAKLLKVHPKTLQRLARRGDVPACKIGRAWVFVEHLLMQMLVAQSTARIRLVESREVIVRRVPVGSGAIQSSRVVR